RGIRTRKPLGSSFSLHEQRKRCKRNSPAGIFIPTPALFYTKQKELAFSSNSFLFLTLRKAPALNGKKKEAG
ncbi:MAG: hypothetical protein IKA16_03635, partial [Oscillospiraceae bacterium]|nr:hypothetical protein [Oscillospiraceae bacterium]